jgi:O-acetyl-ADP-ribose deacetylase (regulator of RNase III)
MKIAGAEIKLIIGDIVEQKTDVIVNAANSRLMGGGGVDGAIHRAGGPKIMEECKMIRENEYPDGLPAGKAVITNGGELDARFVIHTVGPRWERGKFREEEKLSEAYENCLKLAMSKGLSSISFPSISTGAYGFPIEIASKVAVKTVTKYLKKHDGFNEVRFIVFSEYDYCVYRKNLDKLSIEGI